MSQAGVYPGGMPVEGQSDIERPPHLADDIAAADISLTPDEVKRIGDSVKADAVSGARYPEQQLGGLGKPISGRVIPRAISSRSALNTATRWAG